MAVGTLKSNAYGIRPGPGSHVNSTAEGRAKTGETWVKGAVLILDTGELAEAAADPVASIVGVAAEDVTSATANQKTIYWPATVDRVFEATLEDQTNEDHALAEADIYVAHALQVDTSGNWYVDENDLVATSVVVVGPRSDSDIGGTRARVLFRFLNAATIYNK